MRTRVYSEDSSCEQFAVKNSLSQAPNARKTNFGNDFGSQLSIHSIVWAFRPSGDLDRTEAVRIGVDWTARGGLDRTYVRITRAPVWTEISAPDRLKLIRIRGGRVQSGFAVSPLSGPDKPVQTGPPAL